METMVCIKAVPDENEEIRLDKDGLPAIPETEMVGSAFDRCALEMAVRQKEKSGGKVTAVSLGGEVSKTILKNCIAVGADCGIWINEDGDPADTVEKTRITSVMVQQVEEDLGKPFDVIFCGIESTDRGSGVFGPALAEFLGRPYVGNVRSIEEEPDGILATKETETGYELLKMPLPAVIMVTKTEFAPRYPTLKSKMAARKAEIAEWKEKPMFDGMAMVPEEMLRRNFTEAPKKQAGVVLNMEPEQAVKEALELMKTRI